MTNTVSGAYKSVQPNRTQAYLRYKMVADVVAKAEFGNVSPAQTIKFPYGNSVKVQDYGYQSGNLRTDMTLTSDSYTITQAKSAMMGYDKIQNLLVQNPSWVSDVEQEMGQQLARNVDQYVLYTGVAGAYTSVTGGALAAGNILGVLANTDAYLEEALAMPGEKFIVMDPLRAALLPQMNATSGFVKADDALVVGANGFQGTKSVGFNVLVSNNLKYSVTITFASNPSAADTITIGGFTATFRAKGTAAVANEISIGDTAAITEASVKDWINQGGSAGASNYIAASAEDANYMANSQLTCGSFGSDVATITKYGRIGASTTSTVISFGVETSNMLAGVMGAVDMTMLQAPYFEEKDANLGAGYVTHAKDMIMTTLFGAGVWHRKARSLAAISFNA